MMRLKGILTNQKNACPEACRHLKERPNSCFGVWYLGILLIVVTEHVRIYSYSVVIKVRNSRVFTSLQKNPEGKSYCTCPESHWLDKQSTYGPFIGSKSPKSGAKELS